MRRDIAVLGTPIRAVTVIKAAAAAAVAGAVITGCSSMQMGAAAIVGNQRISIAQLDSEVSALSKASKSYSGAVNLPASKAPKEVLSWMIRFDVREDFARRAGITITPSQSQKALSDLYAAASQQAAASGAGKVSLAELAVANGLPPNLLSELGRYQAIELAYLKRVSGGKLPSSQSAVTAATGSFSKAECQAYKNAQIKVNPQYGTLNYSQQTIVPAPDTLSRAEGPASPSAAPSSSGSSGQAPSC